MAKLASASAALAGVKEDTVLAGLRSREKLGSTGFGDGVAIPHCRPPKVKDFVVGVVTVAAGVDFAATDGAPVRILVFIVAPGVANDQHVRLLSRLSEALSAPGTVADLLAARDAATLRTILLRHAETSEEAPASETEPCSLLHVLARGEDTLRSSSPTWPSARCLHGPRGGQDQEIHRAGHSLPGRSCHRALPHHHP